MIMIMIIDEEVCACFMAWQKTFWLCKLGKINADHNMNWHQLMQKKFNQQTVHRSACEEYDWAERWHEVWGQSSDMKCEDWKRSQTKMLFVTDSFQLIQQTPKQEVPWKEWNFKIGVQVYCTVNYADDIVLLPKEETVEWK